MTKRRTAVGAAFLLLVLAVAGAARAQAPRAKPATRQSLWEVRGQSNVVYLLGSIHLLKPSDYPLAAPILRAFTNSQIVVFETDLARLQQPAEQLKMLSASSLPAGETLQGQLSPATFADFTNHVRAAGLPLAMFESLKPSMAAATLEIFELLKLGLNPAYGVDQYFFNRARKDGKQIVPLETVEFQLALVTDFSKPEGELMMKTTLAEIDQTKKTYGQMVAAWKTGDAPALEKLLNDARREAPAIYRRLVTDRNRTWVPKIEQLLRGNKNAMVIVGAGHLVGQDGVVALLQKAGYTVAQE